MMFISKMSMVSHQVMIVVIHIIDLLFKQNAGLFSIA